MKKFAVALAISLAIHAFGMSAVTIVAPDNLFNTEPFTSVTFLGPILERTALEMMVGGQLDVGGVRYSPASQDLLYRSLKIKAPRVDTGKIFTGYRPDQGSRLPGTRDFFSGEKTVPGILFGIEEHDVFFSGGKVGSGLRRERRVIHRPEPPFIERGRFGNRNEFDLKLKVLVDPRGRVIQAEPSMTSGYPLLDTIAVRYVKGWVFEPSSFVPVDGEWIETDILLMVSPEDR